ncbi:Cof-type HAD-IIB family hydrolase [Jeotgalibaca sp. MA1X17-3]|uniref:Cof-type HAD-IIB family hydrolase n=1 Tax=Jeotgalibaca sp. MA1X17-3 TaxID=2908211 RepID=UPI001F3C3FE4|nr:Cof-type HAD-IIB family hydrolase [Jeotgalibaca sp. MA1X17-3]UJF16391.1 Cof-type HAD-IIB family hydrolase [Jeotgalibaca sp. MA1X17-3]
MKKDIKMIAVDMDGTFLNKDMVYDKERFFQLFSKMKEKGIQFVAASGNQFPQLQAYFKEVEPEITFVAENGAYVIEKGKELYSADMGKEVANQAIASLVAYSDNPFVVCGKNTGYVHEDIDDAYFEMFKKYYRKLVKIDDFNKIDDVIFKFATTFHEDEVPEVMDYLTGEMNGHLSPVSSGYGFVDLIQPGIHKGRAIKQLQEKWNLSEDQCVAFGDSQNDTEMLKQVGHSFAMGNADEVVKKAAKNVIGNNNTQSLMDKMEELIGI